MERWQRGYRKRFCKFLQEIRNTTRNICRDTMEFFFWRTILKSMGLVSFKKKRQAYYNQMVEGMVTELCTRYGPLFEIWFDGGASHPDLGAPDVLPIVKKYQPDCLFYHNNQLAEARWGGSESGTVPYPCWATFPTPYSHSGDTNADHINLLKHGDPDGAYWMPAMSDAPLRGYNGRHEWFGNLVTRSTFSRWKSSCICIIIP